MAYVNVKVPEGGARITIEGGKLQVPNHPIIPFVEGDGTGRDIWRADAALGFRPTAHTQLKLQYSFQHQADASRDLDHIVAAQFTLRF